MVGSSRQPKQAMSNQKSIVTKGRTLLASRYSKGIVWHVFFKDGTNMGPGCTKAEMRQIATMWK
jgi:hypothetical protein